jgi:3-hydroxyacyl-[acyl-carrier-protein] dehydratase
MLPTRQNITDFIPQRDPFVMIDRLSYVDEKKSVGELQIREGNIFVEDGAFTEPGLVEAMAQAAAAGTGYHYKVANKRVPVGYIGAIQRLEIFSLPMIDDEITMEINLKTTVLNVALISGSVTCKEKLLATCDMKIVIAQPS